MSRPGSPELVPDATMPPTGEKGARLQEIFEAWVAELPVGSHIPSERDLAEHFGVARMTVRLQLDRLARRGLLDRHRGRGTFVADGRLAHTERLTSFSEDMRARGLEPSSRLLGTEQVRAGAVLAARLEISAGSRAVRIRRVRTADGEPMAIEHAHLPARRFPGLLTEELNHGSLYDLLESRYDVRVVDAVQRVTVVVLTADEAGLLDTLPGRAALRIERTARDSDGRVVEYATSVFRGDRYEVLMHARREGP